MAALTEEQKAARREAQQRAKREAEERQAKQAAAMQARYEQRCRRYREWEAAQDRLRSLVPQALEVLERSLQPEADPREAVKVAVVVLRAAGLQGLEPPLKPSRLSLLMEEVDPDLEDLLG